MLTFQSQFLHSTFSAITLVALFSALLMIWPTFFAIFFAALFLLQSCCAELKVMMLSWTQVGYGPVFASFPRPGFSSML